jgi:hypothetical protein
MDSAVHLFAAFPVLVAIANVTGKIGTVKPAKLAGLPPQQSPEHIAHRAESWRGGILNPWWLLAVRASPAIPDLGRAVRAHFVHSPLLISAASQWASSARCICLRVSISASNSLISSCACCGVKPNVSASFASLAAATRFRPTLRGKIATALATLRHLADVESNWGARVAKTLAIAFALIAQFVLVEASFLQSDANVRLCDRAALKGRLIGASGSELNSL